MKPLATAPSSVSSSPAATAAGNSSSRRNTTTGSTCSNVENSSPDDNTEHPPSISNFVKASRNKTTSQSQSMSLQLMTTSSALNPELTPTMTITPRTAARVSTDTLPLHDSTFNTAATASPFPSCTTGSSSGAIVTASAATNATTTSTTYSSKSGNKKRLSIASSNINPVISSTTVGSSNFKTSPFSLTTNQSTTIHSQTSLIGSSNTTSMSAAKVENGGRLTSTGVSSFNNTNILNNTNNNSKAVISTTANASPGSVNNKNRTNTRMSRTQLHAPPPMSSAAMPPAVMSGLTQPSQPHVPLRERRDSHSVTSQLSASDAWQWQENNDPDDQEQALFEQRLCDDIYGVAVRKINQNGKSSLRYVKCCSVDASELEEYYNGGSGHAASSNRSVSSRSWASRNGFSRFLTSGNNGNGGTSSASNSHADPRDFDAHRNLIPGRKIKVLTWGKKKDVKIPLDRFVAVRKGKTTDRTKRNVCPASRILSLITADEAHNSHGTSATTLDIEAPTKLDRDKFARAFARFLNIPLLENDQQHLTTVDMRSVRSDMTPASLHKDVRVRSSSQQLAATGFIHESTANSSVPDIAMTTTNSYATNGSSFKHAPMPVVTTSGIALEHGVAAGLPPSKASSRIIKTRMNGGGSTGNERNLFSSHSRSNPSSFDVSDQQGSSMHSSSFQNIPTIGTGNSSSSFGNAPFAQQSQHTPAKEATLGIPLNSPMPAATPATTSAIATLSGDDAGSVVSSITGAGFDQDLVEELHMALEKMKVELEESRAEAARAVKVAEQAIQSAENSSSKDWNSTVTHKAAEAAAAAQKKSAEAMARARVAEERLEAEMKNAMLWKKQLENAEEQAGHWQTRAAAAEVQRYAVAESLESERKKNAKLLAASTKGGANKEHKSSQEPFDPFCNSFGELLPDEDEVERLRSKLAMESARRRKLLDELQDLKGSVRVYCRPQPISSESVTEKSTIAVASSEILILDRGNGESAEASGTLSFEFDGILSSDLDQQEVYAEFEAICASVIEGYKVCVMTYGQADAGKTYTMLGKVEYNKDRSVTISDHGIHLRAMKQLFAVLEHRSEMYHDTVTMNLIEVHDERLVDLLAGTAFGESQGKVAGSKRSSSRRLESRSDESSSFQGTSIASNKPKLEIKTNRDGETVVHGVLSVEVSSFDDVCQVWTQSLASRFKRLVEQETDARDFEMGSHVIASLKILSRNISTGVVTTGKMQFVDFASSDVDSKRSSDDTFKFANRSLNTLGEVVRARSQYQRSVPYRNSTITHILSDSLEGDTKVVLIACISPEEQEVQNTACTLRFAQNMRKVIVGKATRHVSTSI